MRDGWHMSQAPPERHGILRWRCGVAQEWRNGSMTALISVDARTRWGVLRRASERVIALSQAGLFQGDEE